jgi:hypothetical protein
MLTRGCCPPCTQAKDLLLLLLFCNKASSRERDSHIYITFYDSQLATTFYIYYIMFHNSFSLTSSREKRRLAFFRNTVQSILEKRKKGRLGSTVLALLSSPWTHGGTAILCIAFHRGSNNGRHTLHQPGQMQQS